MSIFNQTLQASNEQKLEDASFSFDRTIFLLWRALYLFDLLKMRCFFGVVSVISITLLFSKQ